jgi:hypothetical protein
MAQDSTWRRFDMTVDDGPDSASEPAERTFSLRSNRRELVLGFLLLGFAIWVIIGSGLIDNTDEFGILSIVCGVFLAIGGFSFLFDAPRSMARTGSLIALAGSALTTYMFLTLANLRIEMVKFYPLELSLPGALIGILFLIMSFSQLCKSM